MASSLESNTYLCLTETSVSVSLPLNMMVPWLCSYWTTPRSQHCFSTSFFLWDPGRQGFTSLALPIPFLLELGHSGQEPSSDFPGPHSWAC